MRAPEYLTLVRYFSTTYPPMASDIWNISGLVVVAGLLLLFYHDNGDVVEIANNWQNIISLPKKISKRIAIGYYKNRLYVCSISRTITSAQVKC